MKREWLLLPLVKVSQIIINCCLNSVLRSVQKTQQSCLKTTTRQRRGELCAALNSAAQSAFSTVTCAGMHAKLLQSCLTLCNPMARSLPGFLVLGILQARILEWAVMTFSRGSS